MTKQTLLGCLVVSGILNLTFFIYLLSDGPKIEPPQPRPSVVLDDAYLNFKTKLVPDVSWKGFIDELFTIDKDSSESFYNLLYRNSSYSTVMDKTSYYMSINRALLEIEKKQFKR